MMRSYFTCTSWCIRVSYTRVLVFTFIPRVTHSERTSSTVGFCDRPSKYSTRQRCKARISFDNQLLLYYSQQFHPHLLRMRPRMLGLDRQPSPGG